MTTKSKWCNATADRHLGPCRSFYWGCEDASSVAIGSPQATPAQPDPLQNRIPETLRLLEEMVLDLQKDRDNYKRLYAEAI